MEIGNPLPPTHVTFSVTGPATYQGGTQQYVSTNTDAYSNANSTYIGGVPDAFYHSPGDPELQVEGGMTRIALRSQFTPGTVTVTATAPGLTSGSASFPIVAVPDPRSRTSQLHRRSFGANRADGDGRFLQRHQLDLDGSEPAGQLQPSVSTTSTAAPPAASLLPRAT